MSDIGLGEKRAAMVLAAVLAAAAVEAEDRLTLLEAVTRALSSYPSVQASAAQVEVADAAVDEAEAARFPTVSVGASATRYQEPTLVHPIHAFTPALIPPFDQNLFQAVADVRYSLFDGGGRSAGIEENRARRQSAESALLEARQRLLSQLIQQYLSVLSRARILEIESLKTAVARFDEVSRIEKLRVDAGVTEIDYTRAEAERLAAEAGLIEARYSEIAACAELARAADNQSPEWVTEQLRSEP